MICETCHGAHGWWVDGEGKPLLNGLSWAASGSMPACSRECHDCIAGISSCCDSAVSAQPEPEPRE